MQRSLTSTLCVLLEFGNNVILLQRLVDEDTLFNMGFRATIAASHRASHIFVASVWIIVSVVTADIVVSVVVALSFGWRCLGLHARD